MSSNVRGYRNSCRSEGLAWENTDLVYQPTVCARHILDMAFLQAAMLGDEIVADALDDELRLALGRISYSLVNRTLPARRVQAPSCCTQAIGYDTKSGFFQYQLLGWKENYSILNSECI